MSNPAIIEDNPPRKWLTIPEVCAYLKVTEDEWDAWRARGETPLHIVRPDRRLMVRPPDLARWLHARTIELGSEPSPTDGAEVRAQRPRVARGSGRRLARRWLPHIARRRSGRDGQR